MSRHVAIQSLTVDVQDYEHGNQRLQVAEPTKNTANTPHIDMHVTCSHDATAELSIGTSSSKLRLQNNQLNVSSASRSTDSNDGDSSGLKSALKLGLAHRCTLFHSPCRFAIKLRVKTQQLGQCDESDSHPILIIFNIPASDIPHLFSSTATEYLKSSKEKEKDTAKPSLDRTLLVSSHTTWQPQQPLLTSRSHLPTLLYELK